MRSVRCLSISLFSLLLFSSCARVPRLSDYRFDGEPLSREEAGEFQRHLLTEHVNFHSLRMFSRCAFSYGDDRYEFRYAFVARSPDQLRIEQFPLTGFYSLSALVSSALMTTVVFQSEQRALVMPAGSTGLQDLFGVTIPLKESDVGLLLSGNLPQRFVTGAASLRRAEGGSGELLYRSSTIFARFSEDFRLREMHLFDPENEREQLELSYIYDEQSVPRAFVLRLPREGVELECSAQQRSRDVAVKDDVFNLNIPGNYSVDRRKASAE